MTRRELLRNGLWVLFGAALAATIGYALHERWNQPAALPILGLAPAFELTERSGARVSLEQLAGRPFVVDFVFTRCTLACPTMTGRMAKIGAALGEGDDFRRVSITVDPEHDTPAVLTEFADKYAAPSTWWFLTGDRDEIHALSRQGFLLGLDPATGDPTNPIGHSTRFVLVDGVGRIRGYYDAMHLEEVQRLDQDLLRLVRAGGR